MYFHPLLQKLKITTLDSMAFSKNVINLIIISYSMCDTPFPGGR